MLIDQGAINTEKNQYSFENEPGYMSAMYGALGVLLEAQAIGHDLDADLVVQLHEAAINQVVSRDSWAHMLRDRYGYADACLVSFATNPESYKAQQLFQDSRFRLEGVFFGVNAKMNTLTAEGFTELVAETQTPNATYRLHRFDVAGQQLSQAITDPTAFDAGDAYAVRAVSAQPRHASPHANNSIALEARLNQLLQEYRTASRASTDPPAKIRAIARFCASLERTHVFSDGNARTVGFLVVNKLLLEAGLGPAMIEDPNRFDGLSVDELTQEIVNGQAAFERYADADESNRSVP